MATVTATRAASTFPVSGMGEAGTVKAAYGQVSITANPAAATVYEMCRVPNGAVILGGEFFGTRLESATTVKLDIDVGLGSDTDALGNFGPLRGSAVTAIRPEVGYRYPLGNLVMVTGPQTASGETIVNLTVNASARTFLTGGGNLNVLVWYLVP
jgi:hypothetical protein